jgi:hypothetical protein
MKYITQKRLASLKQYLNDCKNGKDTVEAWNEHKARMENNLK